MKALIINSQNDILFTADLDEGVREIEIAGAIAHDGAPVNRHIYKVTRSQANLKRAERMDLDHLKRHTYRDLVFYTV